MTVQQLIKKLETADPSAIVLIWDPGNDKLTAEVYVNKLKSGQIMISDSKHSGILL